MTSLNQRLLALVLCVAPLALCTQVAWSQEKVLEIESVDRILVQYRELPVYLSLANIEIPDEPAIRKLALERITSLINGKGVDVLYDESYGHDESGMPRVYLRQGQAFVNVILVSEGLARYVASENPTTYERLLANAAKMAERDQVGLWATAAEGVAEAAPDKPTPKPAAKPVAKPGSRYASELNGTYYYPEGHPTLANVHKNRIIYYNDEESARAAGKQRAPEVNQASIAKDDGSLQAAQSVFDTAEQMLAKAQAMPATPERDRAYTEALVVLTESVQRYSNLMEKSPNDEALGEKLRRAMQLRYAAMKMRRL